MDIHKPKPWHGWREFLKEYGIIVLGVLTALGAEQIVEQLHWLHQVEVSEARIDDEIGRNLVVTLPRLVLQKCYDNRLAELRDQLLAPGPWRANPFIEVWTPAAGRKPPPFVQAGMFTSAVPPVYLTSLGAYSDGAWSSAISSGVALHLPAERAAAYTRLYRGFEGMRDLQSEEGQIQARLSPLSLKLQVTAADRTRYLETVGELNFLNVKGATFARGILQAASDLGVRIPRSKAAEEIAFNRRERRWAGCQLVPDIPLGPN